MIHLVLLVYKRIDSIAKNGTVLLEDGSVFAYQNKQIIILYFTECSLLQVARQELLQKERSPPWVPESTVRIQRLQVRR